METNLKKMVEATETTSEQIARILVRNLSIDKDLSYFLALELINQALGTDVLGRYQKELRKKELQVKKEKRIYVLKKVTVFSLKVISIVITTFILLYFLGTGLYRLLNPQLYPRRYILTETVRFTDLEGTNSTDKYSELSKTSNLCINGFRTIRNNSVIPSSNATCLKKDKVESINSAFDKAVNEDYNGVIWNQPNGTGELWEVNRNHYRFVITATKDETFIQR